MSDVLNMTGRNPESVTFGAFRFVAGDGLWRNGQPVSLPPRALGVLTTLLAAPGSVVSKQQLMDAVWPDTFVTESSLLEAIGLLRDALGDDRKTPTYIQTVHRRGYRFIGECRLPGPDSPLPSSAGVIDHERPLRTILIACATYAITTVCVAIVFALFGQHPIEKRTSRFSISLPGNAAIDALHGAVAVSPDGAKLVYVAGGAGRSRLFVRSIDREEPIAIDGTDDAADPFFSPDGKWIGFFAHGTLQKISIDGGRPVMLCAARAAAGATWTADNTIIFGGGPGGGLARISAEGGGRSIGAPDNTPVVIATPAPGSRDLRFGWPDLLPGDRGVLFTSITLAGSDVSVIDLRTGKRTTLAEDAAFARYSPTGHVVFERHGRLEAARFSLSTLATIGDPTPLVSGVSVPSAALANSAPSGPRFAFSQSGALVYVPASGEEHDDALQWINPQFIGGGESISPTWRPDGLEIAFAFSKAGPFNLFVKGVDSNAGAAPLFASQWNQFPTSWMPDASALAFTEFQPLTGADIWVVDVRTRERRPLVRTLFDETWARFSPDGRSVAYMSNETGRWEIYVRASSGAGARVRVSDAGGIWPCWSRDGRTIYFSAGGRAMAAAISNAPALSASAPIAVPGADAMALAGGATPGDRLLVQQASAPGTVRAELRVVLEWFTELSKRG